MIDAIFENISIYVTETIPQMNFAEMIVSILSVLVIVHALILLGLKIYKRSQ